MEYSSDSAPQSTFFEPIRELWKSEIKFHISVHLRCRLLRLGLVGVEWIWPFGTSLRCEYFWQLLWIVRLFITNQGNQSNHLCNTVGRRHCENLHALKNNVLRCHVL
jgi:hypothetical protein